MFQKGKWKVVVSVLLVLSLVAVLAGCGKTEKKEAPKAFKPEKPITMVVPMAAGGSTDMLARAVEKVWSKYSPQPLQIVNKPGGGGIEGSVFVSRAKPDGYTLIMGYGSGHDLVMPHIQKVEYDPFRDLTPVARLSIHTVAVLVPENSQFKSVKDVIDWAKKENKPVTASVSVKAGAVDLVMRGIGKAANINVTPIPHAGGAQSITSLVGGQMMIGGGHPAEVISQIKANRVRAIGIATPERDPAMPDVPTLREQGINFHTWGSVKGVAAPKGTPKEIVDYYADVLKKVAEDPDFKKAMADMYQPIMYQGPEEFGKFMHQASDDYAKLVKELGLDKQ
ncbi:MAG: tripartite tricarboxylate transporter substrate binding protein [Negativicutes bacterium]|nr:tripartite tricarboxylate transporter substrate binding protein [Negativicutes bacterium]